VRAERGDDEARQRDLAAPGLGLRVGLYQHKAVDLGGDPEHAEDSFI
jgi:hypothetical protein